MAYDAFIFDNDGVLTHPTNDAVWQSVNELAFQDHGVMVPDRSHVETLTGRPVGEVVSVGEEYGIDAHAFWRTREHLASEAQRSELVWGRKRLYDDVRLLESIEVPVGIVSNNQQATIDAIVEQFELSELVEVAYGREPTIEGLRRMKPNPHYLERAIADLGADDPLYVGDSAVDVAAATALGIDSAFIRRPHRTGYELDHEPTYEYDDLWGLREHLDRSQTVRESRDGSPERGTPRRLTTEVDGPEGNRPNRRSGASGVDGR